MLRITKNNKLSLRHFVCLALPLFSGVCLYAQSAKELPPGILRDKLQKSIPGIDKIELLQALSKYYILKPGNNKADIDSAALLNKESEMLSSEFKYVKGTANNLLLAGEIYHKQNNDVKATASMNEALKIFNENNLHEQAGNTYMALAKNYEKESKDLDSKIYYYQKAQSSYRQAGITELEAATLKELGNVYKLKKDFNNAIKTYQEALAKYQSIHYKSVEDIYSELGYLYNEIENPLMGFQYQLQAAKIAEELNDTGAVVGVIYNKMGIAYWQAEKLDSANNYFEKALKISIQSKDTETIESIYINMVMLLPNLGKKEEALNLLKVVTKNYPIEGTDNKLMIECLFTDRYMALNQYDSAKPHLYKSLELFEQSDKNPTFKDRIYFTAINYFYQTKQYQKALSYIEKRDTLARITQDREMQMDNELFWFQVDSAKGDYVAAIQHFEKSRAILDSMSSVEKIKQLNELQVKYNTEKKDHNIQSLTEKNRIQNITLQKERITRNSIIAGCLVLLIFLALGYNRYRLKQHTNFKLQKQQEEINKQNELLKKLLGEKEWLLREIHHRVKNNLQIVISLLNTQSAYLDNEDALLAISNSQHRMHAMSLIHQKLYQSDNLSSIDMQWYIHELVSYMRECFDTDRRMEFKLDNDKVELDVAQAVPLGLILNEAISNAIKYAFPQNKKGIIYISLKKLDNDKCQLRISDNGIGLPPEFELENSQSLGMSLMLGLSDQIDGTFNLETSNGLTINIIFTIRHDIMSAENDLKKTI